MKRLKRMNPMMAYTAAILLLTSLATSCLEGGSNSVTSSTVGIMRRAKDGRMVMDNPYPYGAFYAPELATMNEGAGVVVHFTLDRDAAENSASVIKAKGYCTVKISWMAEVEKYRISAFTDPGAPDTSKAMKDEVVVKNPANLVRGYVRGYLFIEHVVNQSPDQRNEWYLTYDPNAKPEMKPRGHTYSLYLRSTKRTPGSKPAVDIAANCAYFAKNYLEQIARKEKEAGNNEAFYICFNYVSAIKDGVPVWSQFGNTLPVNVSGILGNK